MLEKTPRGREEIRYSSEKFLQECSDLEEDYQNQLCYTFKSKKKAMFARLDSNLDQNLIRQEIQQKLDQPTAGDSSKRSRFIREIGRFSSSEGVF